MSTPCPRPCGKAKRTSSQAPRPNLTQSARAIPTKQAARPLRGNYKSADEKEAAQPGGKGRVSCPAGPDPVWHPDLTIRARTLHATPRNQWQV